MTDGTGTTTYGYDALYRLTDVTYPDESTEAYESMTLQGIAPSRR